MKSKKHFPRALQRIKFERYGTIGQMAKTSGIAEGTLSRYLVGDNRPRNLKALCSKLADDEVAALLQAHLEDQIPEGFEHLVRVVANPEGRPNDQSIEEIKLSERTRLTLEAIANLFREKPSSIAFFKMITHYLRAGKSSSPGCAYEANPRGHVLLERNNHNKN